MTDKQQQGKVYFSKKELELICNVVYMGYLWTTSLIHADVENGPADMKIAKRAYRLIKKKIKKINHEQ